jgi:UDP-glucose 4-epimerase
MRYSIGIVGPKGFIGRAVCKHFGSLGFDLRLINRKEFQTITNQSKYLEIAKLDYVIWLASSVNPQTAELRPELAQRDLRELEEFTLGMGFSPGTPTKIIFVSSGGCVYSGNEPPFAEDALALGSNDYGVYKCAAEKIIENSSTPYAIVRVSNVYGPNQPVGRGQGVIAEWVESVKNATPIKVFGSLDNARDFLFIDDFNDALEAIIHNDFSGTINIGSGKPTSLKQVLECIKSVAKSEVLLENYPNRGIDRQEYFLDISKAKKYLDWEPKISIDIGIELAFNFNNPKL